MSPEQAIRFGAYLRERREAQQLSIREVARRVGIQDTTIMRLEQGKFSAPAPDKLRRLSEVLDIPPNDLFVMADYMVADELPSPSLYLRAKYPDLPPEAIEEMEQYLQGLMREHGATGGPKAGEDEN
jgi:transcriptional regulator with XRE-family HTH domain